MYRSKHYDTNASLHKNAPLDHVSHLKNLAQKYREIADLHDKAMGWHKDEHNKLETNKKYHLD